MKFVLAPDKFKNSLTGFDFCKAVSEGILQAAPHAVIDWCPLADGGDGTIDVINYYLKAEKISKAVSDPFFEKIDSNFLYNAKDKIAFIEMAEASGMKVLGMRKPDCIKATSLGTGELIKCALLQGAKKIILGIGGSACNDAATGIAHALGYRFIAESGEELKPTGENLLKIHKIEDKQVIDGLKNVEFKIACDVDNPFYGKRGAAHVYSPQKGATKQQVELLDKGLEKLAGLLQEKFNIDVQQIPGAGAAGGVGGGARCFLNAQLISGIDMIIELSKFNNRIKDANYIITGEGILDSQTLDGKTIRGVIKSAKEYDIPVIALCGSVALDEKGLNALGVSAAFSIVKGISELDDALKNVFENLRFTAFNLARLLKVK